LGQELYSADELDELVGPIALYPDPLLTNVLTGATQPDQIKQAEAYLKAGKPVSEDMKTGFDSAVNALLYYPDVLAMLDENFEWTSAIGWATANQLSDVMEAVQRFRLKARTAGNLKTNDKIQVIEEGTVIRIEPADPQVIYVPMYEPQTVVVKQTNPVAPVLTYSAAIAVNVLLWDRVFNWHSYGCYPTPYGWRPPAAYYRPYGWQGSNIYRGNAWTANRNVNINRPVTINRNTINNINYRGGGNNVRVNRPNNGVSNRPSQRPTNRVTPKSNPKVSRPSTVTNRRPGQRPPVTSPTRPATRPSTGARPTTRPTTRPSTTKTNSGRGISNYSRTGGTVRSSQRGASSRGSRSYSGGGSRSGGGRSGGGRSGGGRRR